MEKLLMILQFIVGLSLIVGIHELGHMLIAKFFGIRVDHYMIGFPPKIFKKKIGETEYAIGALLFGGSAKIAGMVDESMDTKSLASPPKPWEFRSKPTWQRLLVILGGIIFNMISGIFIFISILYFVGANPSISKEEMNKYGINPTELGTSLGFEEGDKINKVNNKDFVNFEELQAPSVLLQNHITYQIERNGEDLEITIPKEVQKQINNSKGQKILFQPLVPYIIKKINKNSPAKEALLQANDKLLTINDEKVIYLQSLTRILKKYAGKTASVKYMRDDSEYTTLINVDSEGKIGVEIELLLEQKREKYSLGRSIIEGVKLSFRIVWTNILAIKQMIMGNLSVKKSLKGPVGIVKAFGGEFNIVKFWYIVAFLSMMIAFTNLLPFPVLDGGHAVFIIYEMITGRKVSEKTMMVMQVIGTIFFMLLIGFTLINDVMRLFS